MEKVYIVTRGEYSSYRIVGAFSSKENAEAFMECFDGVGYDIEVFDLNPITKEIQDGHKAFFVSMDKSGNVSLVKIDNYPESFGVSPKHGFDSDKRMYNHCFAKTEEQAIKITNEKRLQLIANNEWET